MLRRGQYPPRISVVWTGLFAAQGCSYRGRASSEFCAVLVGRYLPKVVPRGVFHDIARLTPAAAKVGAALCCEEAGTRHEFLWSGPASSQHKAAPTGGVQALNFAQY